MQEFIVEKNDAGQRLDKYIFKLLKNANHSLIYKQLRNKNITLNRKKAKGDEILALADAVQIFMADETIARFRDVREMPFLLADRLRVVYEDADILIADKPVGVLSQKAHDSDISMNEYLLAHLQDKEFGNTFKPAFCNRLDRNTSGLMLAGISLAGSQYLSRILKERTLAKYYLAVVCGRVTEKLSVHAFLAKDHATNKVAIYDKPPAFLAADPIDTEYEPLAFHNEYDLTLLRVHLITGKTHQIRAHLAYLNHPILGDRKYGQCEINDKFNEKVQLLHAYEVIFPESGEEFAKLSRLAIRSDYPQRFARYFPEKEA